MSNGVARLRVRVQQHQAELARMALEKPNGTDAYSYGKVCGQYQALATVLHLIAEIEDDERRAESDLPEKNPTFS